MPTKKKKRDNKRVHALKRKLKFNWKILALFGVIFGIIGALLLLNLRAATTGPNAANRIILYTGCASSDPAKSFYAISDAELDEYKRRGIGGFMCGFSKLYGLGGGENWQSDPNHNLVGNQYVVQRTLKGARLAERVHARGMKIYLGFDVVANGSQTSPFGGAGWHDDAHWNSKVIPATTGFAGAAKWLGFDGVFMDLEMIGCGTWPCGEWNWDYHGNPNSETQTRAIVKQRGAQIMSGFLSVFPNMELTTYDYRSPEDANAVIQRYVNKVPDTQQYQTIVHNFFDGLTSIDGYKSLRINDATFYKSAHISSFDKMIPYDQNRMFAYMSRTFSNWDYLSSRISLTPFSWIDQNLPGEAFSYYRGDQYVYDQMQTFRKYGMGGEFWNFMFGGAKPIDSPWNYSAGNPSPVKSWQDASQPGVVDSTEPTLNITNPASGSHSTSASNFTYAGNAKDNIAIHFIKWSNNRGGSGMAKMTWRALNDNCEGVVDNPATTNVQERASCERNVINATNYSWQQDWTANIPLQSGQNILTFTVQDTKGNTTVKTITVNPTGGGGDTQAPSTPSSLAANNVTQTSASFSWNASTDNVGVTRYKVFRGFTEVGTPTGTSFTDSNLTANTTYNYFVKAVDAAGNESQASNVVTFTTQAAPPPPPTSNLDIKKASAQLSIDGDLTEFNQANAVTITNPNGSTLNAKVLWDNSGLYLGFTGTDTQINGSIASRDGPVWQDDAIEWFLDTLNNKGGSGSPNQAYMLSDDYQGITNVLGTKYDTQGSASGQPNETWNGSWQSASKVWGTVNNNSDTDVAYTTEVKIPWSAVGVSSAPTDNTLMGFSFVLDDKDASSSAALMWPNITSGSFQNASKWQTIKLISTTADTTPPVVTITAPPAGATISGTTTINATATDASGIDKVDFIIDGQLKHTDTTSPYSYPLNTTTLTNDDHVIDVRATDKNGLTATESHTVKVLNDTQKPTVNILAPISGANVTGTVPVTISANDNTGISRVIVLLNVFTNLGTATASGGNYRFNWDTSSLASGTYQLTAVAYDLANNETAFTIPVTVNHAPPADTTPPSVPANLASSNITPTSATISWSASTDNVGVTGYHIFRGGTQVGVVTSPTLSFTDTNLGASTTYSYTVKAVDGANNLSLASTPLVVTTTTPPDNIPPSTPSGLVSNSQTPTTINLSWTASTDNVGVSRYQVFRNGTLIANPISTSYTDTNLQPNTAYSYTVRAHDAVNNVSPASSALLVTTLQAPDTEAPSAPAGLTAQAASATRVNLSWTASTDNVSVRRYLVQRASSATNNVFVTITTTTTTTYADLSALPKTAYQYRIVAEDEAGNTSSPSSPASATTPDLPDTQAPTVPTNLTARSNTAGTQIDLTWTASTDNVAVSGYRITRDGQIIANVSGSTLSFGDANRTPGRTYTYEIIALDAAGNASQAAMVTGNTGASTKQGDFNGDQRVDVFDLSLFLTDYNKTGTSLKADLNTDGKVDVFDLSILLSKWEQ